MPRPRSEKAHRKVIEAALNLLASRGFEATSMDAIAETSGVSKATIYKHWPDKDALLLELMAEINGLHSRPAFDTGAPRADIVALLSYRPPERSDLRERITPHFMAYAGRNPAFGDAWRNGIHVARNANAANSGTATGATTAAAAVVATWYPIDSQPYAWLPRSRIIVLT